MSTHRVAAPSIGRIAVSVRLVLAHPPIGRAALRHESVVPFPPSAESEEPRPMARVLRIVLSRRCSHPGRPPTRDLPDPLDGTNPTTGSQASLLKQLRVPSVGASGKSSDPRLHPSGSIGEGDRSGTGRPGGTNRSCDGPPEALGVSTAPPGVFPFYDMPALGCG